MDMIVYETSCDYRDAHELSACVDSRGANLDSRDAHELSVRVDSRGVNVDSRDAHELLARGASKVRVADLTDLIGFVSDLDSHALGLFGFPTS